MTHPNHPTTLDPELGDRWTPKRLGKRLADLWPHIEAAVRTATREKDRKGFTIFTFGPPAAVASAEFAEFQSPVS